MNKKLLVILLVIGTLMLSACSPQTTVAPTTEGVEAPTNALMVSPTNAPTEGPAPTLTIWIDKSFAPIVEEISQNFTAQYGVKVVVQGMGMDDIKTQFLVSAPAGEGPDLIEGGTDWIGAMVEGGVLAEVDLGEKTDLFLPSTIQASTFNEKLYGMPLITENVGLFRNTDLVPEAPKTLDELETVCENVVAKGIEYCLLLQEGDAYHFYPIQTAFGGYVFGTNADGTYNASDVGIDDAGSIASGKWLDAIVKKGYIKPGTPYDTARTLFAEGKAAMYITGPWNISFFREQGTAYAISPMPDGPEKAKPFLGVRGFMVNSFSKQPALAQTYLTEFWATDEVMQKFAEATIKAVAYLPVRDHLTDPDIASLAIAGKYGVPQPTIPEMNAFWSIMGDAITLILQQREDPVTAFQNAAKQMRNQ